MPHPGVDYVLGVLDSYSLTAIYSTTTLDWSVIKAEIDNCQPLMLRVGRHDFSADTADSGVDHFIVVTGYLEKDCSRFLLINDPWTPCEGCQYALSYAALTGGDAAQAAQLGIRSISQWFYGIRPTTWATGCPPPGKSKPVFTETELPCPLTRKPPRLAGSDPRQVMHETLGSLRACFPKLTGGPILIPVIQNRIAPQKRYSLRVINESLVRDPLQHQAPFDTIRRQLFYWPPTPDRRSSFEAIVQERRDPRRTLSDCPSQPEKGGYWLLESFGRCSFFCATGTSCESSSQVLVAKSKQRAKWVRVGKGGYSFGLVVYPAFRYTFRRFIYKHRTYYYSPTGYPDLLMADGTPFRANVAYLGSETLYQLHQRTNKSN